MSFKVRCSLSDTMPQGSPRHRAIPEVNKKGCGRCSLRRCWPLHAAQPPAEPLQAGTHVQVHHPYRALAMTSSAQSKPGLQQADSCAGVPAVRRQQPPMRSVARTAWASELDRAPTACSCAPVAEVLGAASAIMSVRQALASWLRRRLSSGDPGCCPLPAAQPPHAKSGQA